MGASDSGPNIVSLGGWPAGADDAGVHAEGATDELGGVVDPEGGSGNSSKLPEFDSTVADAGMVPSAGLMTVRRAKS